MFDWRKLIEAMGLQDAPVCEVGVGPFDISILPYVYDGVAPICAVEPHPVTAERVRNVFPEVELHECAIGSEHGTGRLTDNEGSSGLHGAWMPTPGSGSIEVQVYPFDAIEQGESFGVMNIDCEGGEWDVLRVMESRPELLGIELWPQYPHRDDCLQWLADEGYKLLATSGPCGETMMFYL